MTVKHLFLSVFTVLTINKSNATVYITELINNTDLELRVSYNVPVNIKIISATPQKRLAGAVLTYCSHDYPIRNLRVHQRTHAILDNAYLPESNGLLENVITLGFYDTCTASFALLLRTGNKVERVNSLPTKINSPLLYESGTFNVDVLNGDLIEGATYTLEVTQISPEIVRKYRIHELIVQDSFKITFKRNNTPRQVE